MSIALLYPAGLVALLALALPVLLHLARRPLQRTLDFAALRWIAAAQRPQRRLVLQERLLLVLRLILLALLALLLAGPVLPSRPAATGWVVVMPGADLAQARRLVPEREANWRWLAAGFPPADSPMPTAAATASLLRELDATLPAQAQLTVVVPAQLAGLDGARLALGREVGWIITDPASAPPRAPAQPELPTLAVRYPPGREPSLPYLTAAVATWQQDAPGVWAADIASGSDVPGPSIDVLVWLHDGALPGTVQAWVVEGRTLVVEPDVAPDVEDQDPVALWRSSTGEVLARSRRAGAGRIVELTRPLRSDTLPQLLDPGFPDALRELLTPPPAPDSATAAAHVPLLSARARAGAGLAPEHRTLAGWLALAIAALFLAERLLASRTSRWVR